MNTLRVKVIISTIAAGISMWIVAGIWHNLIMANLYEEVHAEHEGIGILLIAYLVLAGFMSYLYPRFKRSGSLQEGILFGAFIGLLWVFPHGLAMVGAHEVSIMYVLKNSLWHMVEQAVGGVVVWRIFTIKRV